MVPLTLEHPGNDGWFVCDDVDGLRHRARPFAFAENLKTGDWRARCATFHEPQLIITSGDREVRTASRWRNEHWVYIDDLRCYAPPGTVYDVTDSRIVAVCPHMLPAPIAGETKTTWKDRVTNHTVDIGKLPKMKQKEIIDAGWTHYRKAAEGEQGGAVAPPTPPG